MNQSQTAPGIQWHSISPKLAFRTVASMLVGLALWIAIAVALYLMFGDWWWLFGGIPAVLTLATMPMAFVRVRSIGYALRQDDLLVRRGVMFREQKAVPYGRLQHVDVNQGPFDRMMGIYTLQLVTAASSATIPGLTRSDSDGLRDHLIRVAETRRAGL